MKYFNWPMSLSLFSSFQENTKCESSFFADTCTPRVPIFYNQFVMVCDFEVTIFRSIFRADEALISQDETSGMTE